MVDKFALYVFAKLLMAPNAGVPDNHIVWCQHLLLESRERRLIRQFHALNFGVS